MSLRLKLFHPAADKVARVEFHPVLPWVVSVTKSDHVCVWDWRTRQVVWETQLGGSDEDLCADAELARIHLRDPAFSPNPSLLHPTPAGPKREPSGRVRDARFLDTDVAQVQLTWQHTTAAGCSTPPPRAEEIRTLRGQRLLVLACEAKVLVVDLASRRVLELGRGVFEGKSPTALAFLLRAGLHHHQHGPAPAGPGGWLLESPVLAVGCADGIVRCVQLFPIKPVARLVSAHKTSVVALAPLAVRGQRAELLAVGHQGGSVALFEPTGRAAAPLSEGLPPRADVKAHDKELLPGSLAAAAVVEDPEDTRCLLFSAGSDNRVVGLEAGTLKEGARFKANAALTCMATWPRGWSVCGVHVLLLGTETGHLLLAHPGSGLVRLSADLKGMVPSGHKAAPKVYYLHVHPTMPGVVAAATNAGTAVLELAAPPQPLPAAPLPLAAPGQALHDDSAAAGLGAAFGGAGGAGATYVTAMGQQVLCVTAAALPNQDMSEFPPNQVMGKLMLASDAPTCRAVITVSHDGGYVAVAWPSDRKYAVFRQGASAWQKVAQGTGTSVAWHSSRDVFAALEQDAPALPLPGAAAGGKPSKDAKKAEKQAEAARAAAEAVNRAAAASAAVRVKEMRGGGGAGGAAPTPLGGPGGLEMRGDTPGFVQGGPLLAVTVQRAAQGDAAEAGSSSGLPPAALLLFDWDSGRRVGPELAEPLVMGWDPSRTMLAMAYPSQLLIVRARPDFQVVSTLPVCGAESLEWAARQLYIATPTHILCALLAPSPPPSSSPASPSPAVTSSSFAAATSAAAAAATAPPARLITLAAPGVPAAAPGAAAVLEGFLPPPATRPPGPLVLLGPRDGCLWMVGVVGQPMALALSHPGFRCCSLVASGDLHGAVTLAARALAPELHDQLAALMVDMDGPRGAAAAATLPGISLPTELRLRCLLRHWQPAVEAADALLAGFAARPPPALWRSAVAAAAFGAGGGGGGYGGGGPQLGEEFVDISSAAGGAPANAPAHPEDFDWTQPLRAAGCSAKAAATAAVAARGQAGGAAAAAAATPSASTLQLVLGLLEELVRAGMYDVARHLAKPVLGHAVRMGGEQLRSLAAVMAQAGMKTDLPALAHSVAAGADGSGREGASLLAALLSGHTALVQDSLREGGATALAALQAHLYGLSTAAKSMAAWRQQLAAAAPAGAAGALGRLGLEVPV